MFYETESNRHGLAHDPFKALVAPRPIGWIGTTDPDGIANLAPYSYFNAVSDTPKMVMFASDGRKDSATNAEATGEFSASLAGRALAGQMNASSIDAPPSVSEFDHAGLTAAPGRLIAAPHVGEAAAALECRVVEIFQPRTLAGGRSGYILVIGQVVGIHIDPAVIRDGRIDTAKSMPLARLGYRDFSDGTRIFEMIRPVWVDDAGKRT